VAPAAPSYEEPEYEEPAATVEPAPAVRPAPQPSRGGGQIGTIAIVLIAAIAGVAAFFASKMLF
jgi:hypothetical protein